MFLCGISRMPETQMLRGEVGAEHQQRRQSLCRKTLYVWKEREPQAPPVREMSVKGSRWQPPRLLHLLHTLAYHDQEDSAEQHAGQ